MTRAIPAPTSPTAARSSSRVLFQVSTPGTCELNIGGHVAPCRRTDVSGLEFVLSYSIRCSKSVEGVRAPVESLVDTGEESVFAVYPDNQVNGEVTIGGVNSVHHTGFFVYTNLESTSYRQVNFDGFELNEATCRVHALRYRWFWNQSLTGTHHGCGFNCCFVEYVDHHLVQP